MSEHTLKLWYNDLRIKISEESHGIIIAMIECGVTAGPHDRLHAIYHVFQVTIS